MEPRAFVHIDYGASEEEIRAVEDLFRDVGVEAEVTPGIAMFSDIPPWAIAIAVELNPFLVKLQQLAAEDAYRSLKEFIRHARDARRMSGAPDGSVEIDDAGSEVTIKGLTPDLPDGAYRALLDLELRTLPPGFVGWSPDRQMWVHYSPDGERELG